MQQLERVWKVSMVIHIIIILTLTIIITIIILILMTNPAHPHPHGQSCSSKQGREGPLSCEPPQQRERVQSQSRQQSGRGPRGVNNKHAGVEICDHFCLLDGCHDSLFNSLGLVASQWYSLIFSSVVEIYHLSASFIITSHLGLGGRFWYDLMDRKTNSP